MPKSKLKERVRDPKSHPVALAFTITEVCSLTKLSRSFVYQLIASGALPAKKCGARTLILFDDLIAFLRNLPSLPVRGVDSGESDDADSDTTPSPATSPPSCARRSQDERWYRDGPPQWLEGRGKSWERPCETAAEARQRRESAARKLSRASFHLRRCW